MTPALPRRTLLAGLSAAIGIGAERPAQAVTEDRLAAIERRRGGRLGVFALDTGSGRTLTHRADERFPLQSTFKGILAALVLSRVDADADGLEREVPYGAKDLLSTSPVTAAHVVDGRMTVGGLCQAILERSDNAAANLLLARVGGPTALTAYARRLGDPVTRFDSYELVRSSLTTDCTTPRAIAGLARTVVLGNALTPSSRTLLVRWMTANVPGRTRLRAAFPTGWTACDRTGTAEGVCNDYAVAWPPGRAPLVVAAYHYAPGLELEPQEAALREVGSAVAAWAA